MLSSLIVFTSTAFFALLAYESAFGQSLLTRTIQAMQMIAAPSRIEKAMYFGFFDVIARKTRSP